MISSVLGTAAKKIVAKSKAATSAAKPAAPKRKARRSKKGFGSLRKRALSTIRKGVSKKTKLGLKPVLQTDSTPLKLKKPAPPSSPASRGGYRSSGRKMYRGGISREVSTR